MAFCTKCDNYYDDEPDTRRMYDGVCDKCSKKLYKKELKLDKKLKNKGNK